MEVRLRAVEAGWIFVTSYVLGIVLTFFMYPEGYKSGSSLFYFLCYAAIGQIVLNALPALIWSNVRGYAIHTTFKLRSVSAKTWVYCVLFYVISQIPLLFIHQITETIAHFVGYQYEVSVYPIATDLSSFFLLLIFIGIIPPLCEELLFRGALLSGYSSLGLWGACAMSAFLFALFHDNPYRIGELFFAALCSALIVKYSGSLLPAIAVHIMTNCSYVIGSYLQGGDLVTNLSQPGGTKPWTIIGTGMLSVAAIFICWRLLERITGEQTKPAAGPDNNELGMQWMLPVVIAIIVFVVKN
ncbi:hypothetical protein SY83_05445 [Paenibacillus swuensis]|uniref:CAAX prenyl protease 2/Lysostaphin resistance protein A-like domain-containing protein n=1 Tax=Paenibacillus swuensis TaxID=1178515 RepID=A0A172TFK6_9BACL|nr:type II CAAX endopeptidase family protein [Paenibacillus swuensis]ANE45838.1 hypothetical protein SY83_05445 [Paenibacillus swuensis]